jgi:hypothetical protein
LSPVACRPKPPATVGAAAAPAPPHRVAAGERNAFFVATSERSFEIARDVQAIAIKDARGHQHGTRLVARDGRSVAVECECPNGCGLPAHASELGIGCIMIQRTPSAPECAGDCVASDKSCGGCGLVYWPSSDAVAAR